MNHQDVLPLTVEGAIEAILAWVLYEAMQRGNT